MPDSPAPLTADHQGAAGEGAPLCVITDFMGADAQYERTALESAGIRVYVAPSRDREQWMPHAREADAVITRHARLDAEAIGDLGRCQVIARYGTGVDNVDAEAAAGRGIVLTYVPGGSTDEVADHTLALILMAVRRIPAMIATLERGEWALPAAATPRRLRGMRLGLVGGGRIGRAVAHRARAFGLEVSVYDPLVQEADWARVCAFEAVLETSDILSLHVPLTPETRGLIGANELARMRPGAILVNTARGGLVDLDAAVEALQSGHLGGLALDTFPQEPLPESHPVRRCDGAILTPHLAYYSAESLAHAKRSVVEEVVAVLNGEEPKHQWTAAIQAPAGSGASAVPNAS